MTGGAHLRGGRQVRRRPQARVRPVERKGRQTGAAVEQRHRSPDAGPGLIAEKCHTFMLAHMVHLESFLLQVSASGVRALIPSSGCLQHGYQYVSRHHMTYTERGVNWITGEGGGERMPPDTTAAIHAAESGLTAPTVMQKSEQRP